MIRRASIHNFKSLRDVQVELERFTVFVGPNGSGKTSVLQGLDILCRTFQQPQANLESEYQSFRTIAATGPVELECLADGIHYRYRLTVPKLKEKTWIGEGAAYSKSEDSVPETWKQWGARDDSAKPLPSSLWLRLEPTWLRQAGGDDKNPRLMSPEGSGMHTALASMALEDPDQWQKLQADLRRIVPSIRRLRHTLERELQFDTDSGNGLNARQASEGTILALGLLAAVHGVNRPGLLLLDDLDRGLHPKAQRELITLLRGLLEVNPDLQIVATTHSPYLLDHMRVDEVRMTMLKDDGATVCAPLTAHPKFPTWKDEMTPGEMWSLFGEKWVAETAVTA